MSWELDWPSIRRKNKAGGDCQVVSAVNIYHVLTGKVVDDDWYNHLIDVAGARYGAAVSIEKVWKELSIHPVKRYRHQLDWWDANRPLPAELSVWYKSHGLHSVACIQYEPITDSYRIPNFNATSDQGWIYGEDLTHFYMDNPDKSEPRWRIRSFGLCS